MDEGIIRPDGSRAPGVRALDNIVHRCTVHRALNFNLHPQEVT